MNLSPSPNHRTTQRSETRLRMHPVSKSQSNVTRSNGISHYHDQYLYNYNNDNMMNPPTAGERLQIPSDPRSPELENYDELLRLAERLGDAKSRGLDRDHIRRLPCVRVSSRYESSQSWCVVCMSDFEESQMLRILPFCNHSFHAKCVDKWLRGSKTCPICRGDVDPEEDCCS